MDKREQLKARGQALDIVHQLVRHHYTDIKDVTGSLIQVEQGFGTTADVIEALGKATDDNTLASLAALIREAGR